MESNERFNGSVTLQEQMLERTDFAESSYRQHRYLVHVFALVSCFSMALLS